MLIPISVNITVNEKLILGSVIINGNNFVYDRLKDDQNNSTKKIIINWDKFNSGIFHQYLTNSTNYMYI